MVSVPQNRVQPGFWPKKGTPGSFWPTPPRPRDGCFGLLWRCLRCWRCWYARSAGSAGSAGIGGGAGSAGSAACANDSVVLEPFLVLLLILDVFLPKDVMC